MGYASHQLGAPLAEYYVPLGEFHDYGTFDGFGAKKKKKKRGFLRKVGRVAKKVGKVALKAAPIVAGLTLGPVGGIAVGAAAGAIGRGKPKFKRILRSAAYGGAAGLVRTGQAGRILVKGGKVAAKLVRGGGRIVGKVGKGAGRLIENIAKGDIGPGEGAVTGAGGGLIYDKLKGRRRRQMPDEPLTPEESPVDSGGGPVITGPNGYPAPNPAIMCEMQGGVWTRSGCIMPPIPGPVDAEGPLPQAAPPPGTEPASPVDTPTSGQLPVAGGTIPGPATGAIMPGSGGEQFRPSADEALPDEAEEPKKPNVAILLAAGVAVLILLNKKKGR